VLVIDDTGDRKDGRATDHVSRQYLGSVGKADNGIVAVTSLWTDERHYYPLPVEPYTPAARLAHGTRDPTFHTKPHIALELVEKAQAARQCLKWLGARRRCFHVQGSGAKRAGKRLAGGPATLPRRSCRSLVGR
jgi:SRSO17 transposase